MQSLIVGGNTLLIMISSSQKTTKLAPGRGIPARLMPLRCLASRVQSIGDLSLFADDGDSMHLIS